MRRLFTLLVLILGAALPARAATIEERIAAELQAQGYEIVETNRTWLGRLRILAETDVIRREIVVNPETGEILRDYSVLLTVLEQRQRAGAAGGEGEIATRGLGEDKDDTPPEAPVGGAPEPVDEPEIEDPTEVDGLLPEKDPNVAIPLLPRLLPPAESE